MGIEESQQGCPETLLERLEGSHPRGLLFLTFDSFLSEEMLLPVPLFPPPVHLSPPSSVKGKYKSQAFPLFHSHTCRYQLALRFLWPYVFLEIRRVGVLFGLVWELGLVWPCCCFVLFLKTAYADQAEHVLPPSLSLLIPLLKPSSSW